MKKSFSFIIPAYKEAEHIEGTISNFLKLAKQQNLDFEIILVIDDTPNDKTLEKSQKIAQSTNEIKIIAREGKLGVGTAIIEGIKKVSKDVTIITVAGKHVDPNDLLKMIEKMNEGYDMVFGDRFSKRTKIPNYPFAKLIANRLCNKVVSNIFGIHASDITSGVKAYRTKLLKEVEIKSKGFEIFLELPVMVYIKGGTNFAVVPLTHHERNVEQSHFNLINEWPKYIKTVIRCYFYKLKK